MAGLSCLQRCSHYIRRQAIFLPWRQRFDAYPSTSTFAISQILEIQARRVKLRPGRRLAVVNSGDDLCVVKRMYRRIRKDKTYER